MAIKESYSGTKTEYCDASQFYNPMNRIPIQGKCYDNEAVYEVIASPSGSSEEFSTKLCKNCAINVKKSNRGNTKLRKLTKKEIHQN